MPKNKKRKERIRVIALAILIHDQHIFVTEYHHPTTGEPYYRPLGGGVEFHERGEDAVQRELLEEIDAHLTHVRYLTMLENIYTVEDDRAHQICLLYTAQFADPQRQSLTYQVTGIEGDQTFQAMWKPLSAFCTGKSTLYPDGLINLLCINNT